MNDFSGIKSSISAWVIGEIIQTQLKLSIHEVHWGFYGEGNYCCYYCKMEETELSLHINYIYDCLCYNCMQIGLGIWPINCVSS